MNRKSFSRFLWLILSFFLFNSIIGADDTSLHYGSLSTIVFPVNDDTVRMVSADINVRFDWITSTVNCAFQFKNEGPDKTVLMGFPKRKKLLVAHSIEQSLDLENIPDKEMTMDRLVINNKDYYPKTEVFDITDFTVIIDSELVESRIAHSQALSDYHDNFISPKEAMDLITEYYVWEVPFEAGETKILKHSYIHHNRTKGSSLEYGMNGTTEFQYYLKSGSTWKSTISQVNVKIENIPVKMIPGAAGMAFPPQIMAVQWAKEYSLDLFQDLKWTLLPKNYTRNGGTVTWHFDDIEPNFNITVHISTPQMKEQDRTRIFTAYLNNKFGGLNRSYSYDTESNTMFYNNKKMTFYRKLQEYIESPECFIDPRSIFLCNMSSDDLKLFKNTIYALRGKTFSDSKLHTHFSEQPWYQPKTAWTEKDLNESDCFNLQLIDNYMVIQKEWHNFRILGKQG